MLLQRIAAAPAEERRYLAGEFSIKFRQSKLIEFQIFICISFPVKGRLSIWLV